MTKEELLKPRYKVIADFPLSSCSIGQILSVENEGDFIAVIHGGAWKTDISRYPHLFRKLEWWEEREEKDMPEYLKFSEEKEDVAIWEVESWNKNVAGVFYPKSKDENGNDFLSIEWYFYKQTSKPATKEEYISYINKNKQA